MQYNIFRIISIEELEEELRTKNYTLSDNKQESGDYELSFYYKYDDNLKISWKRVFEKFGENVDFGRSNVTGVILCKSKNQKGNYAITYGTSSFLVQKLCDKNFAFDFAKRIKLKEVKRMSAKSSASNKNSTIVAFKENDHILYDSGDAITSLSFTPEDEKYGKRIDIGKSIKFSFSEELENIGLFITLIEETLKKEVINKIPLLIKITDADDIKEYTEQLYNDLEKYNTNNDYSNDLSLNEFEIVGTSFYFEEEHRKVIKYNRKSYNDIELYNINDIIAFTREKGISLKDFFESAKVVFYNCDKEELYSTPVKSLLTYTIDDENVTLFEGEWYHYNIDYIDSVHGEIGTIKVIYNEGDNYSTKDIVKYKEKDNDYRELMLNRLLAKTHKGELLDRDLFIIPYDKKKKYKVEIADIVLDDEGVEYSSVKVGNSDSFCYCVDQSTLAVNLVETGGVDTKKIKKGIPSIYSLWLYFEKGSRFFSADEIKLNNLNSIMLLSKISSWSKEVKKYGKIPVIRVNKFER